MTRIKIILTINLASLLLIASSFAQIDPGKEFDLQGFLDKELSKGKKEIVIPPGRYRVKPIGNTHLVFDKLKDVTILANDVELICTETVQAIQIKDCVNFKLVGLTVDYDPLPFTQGEIIDISEDKTTLTVDLIKGYEVDGIKTQLYGDKLEIFDAITGELSTATYYGITYKFEPSTQRVVINKQARFWDTDVEKVGDIVVLGTQGARRVPHAILPQRCTGLVLENVTLYAGTTFGFFETYCNDSRYISCRVDRRSLESEIKPRGMKRMRSNTADGFHSKFAENGPAYIGCVARYNGDDGIAINGDFDIITETNGDVLTVVTKGGKSKAPDLSVGETVELVSFSGARIPNAKIIKIKAGRSLTQSEYDFLDAQKSFRAAAANTKTAKNVYYITIDRPVDLPMGSMINSASRVGNGYEIRDCTLGPNRSRGMVVKASDGIITGNTFVDNWGEAIKISPEFNWLEAGSGSNIIISNNVITGCRSAAIGVYAFGGDGTTSPIGAHDNIQIIGNQISNSTNPAIAITSTSNLLLEANTIDAPNNEILLITGKRRFGRSEDPSRVIYLENVETK